jgi:DNA-binding MarR family transcriptional regulator
MFLDMSGKLLQELHKSSPFESVQQELILNVMRTADHFSRSFEELLRPYNLSSPQYNVLRILRGVTSTDSLRGIKPEPQGIPCKCISEKMITRDPDITRLLDRLEARNLITRHRDGKDRRVVYTRITEEGLRILAELDQPVLDFHVQKLSHMPEEALTQLIEQLELIRSTGGGPAPVEVNCDGH